MRISVIKEENALNIVGLKKSIGNTTLLRNINLDVKSGQFVGMIGLNGSGKTSLVECVVGLKVPDAGQISVYGSSVDDLFTKTRIGYMPQDLNIIKEQEVRKVIRFIGQSYGLSAEYADKRIKELSEQFGIANKMDQSAITLSGGMQRRVLLMCSILHDPDIILIDEPTTGLDPSSREQIWNYLKTLHTQGKTILMTSHYTEEIELLCSHICVMKDGVVSELIEKDELLNSIIAKSNKILIQTSSVITQSKLDQTKLKDYSMSIRSSFSLDVIVDNKDHNIKDLVEYIHDTWGLVSIKRPGLEQLISIDRIF